MLYYNNKKLHVFIKYTVTHNNFGKHRSTRIMNICLAKERTKKKKPNLEKKTTPVLIFFFFFFFSSSSSMHEMDPLSGRILRTNLSDVKNSCKHTTYKSNINLKWNTRSKKNSKITQWQTPWLVVPYRPSIYLILYSEHMISLTNWVDLHNFLWYS